MTKRKLDDCLNVAMTSQFKILLNRAAFLNRTTMSSLTRKWITEGYERWKADAPDRIQFDIFLTPTEAIMLSTRGYRIEEISAEGCTDLGPSVPTPDRIA